jgi:hypothetical protein
MILIEEDLTGLMPSKKLLETILEETVLPEDCKKPIPSQLSIILFPQIL